MADALPKLLAALIVTLEDPAPVGAPLISPVPVLTESPSGRLVALKDVGPLVAVIKYVKVWLRYKLAVKELVMTGTGHSGEEGPPSKVAPTSLRSIGAKGVDPVASLS